MEKDKQLLSAEVEARYYEYTNGQPSYIDLVDRNTSFMLEKDEFEALLVFAKKIGWVQ